MAARENIPRVPLRKRPGWWVNCVLVVCLTGFLVFALVGELIRSYPGADNPQQLAADFKRALAEKNLLTIGTIFSPSERSELSVAKAYYQEKAPQIGKTTDFGVSDWLNAYSQANQILKTVTVETSAVAIKIQPLAPKLARLQVQGKLGIKITAPQKFLETTQQLVTVLGGPKNFWNRILPEQTAGFNRTAQLAGFNRAAQPYLSDLQTLLPAGLIAVKEGQRWFLSAEMTVWENIFPTGAGVNYQADWEHPLPTAEKLSVIQKQFPAIWETAVQTGKYARPQLASFFPTGMRRLLLVYGNSNPRGWKQMFSPLAVTNPDNPVAPGVKLNANNWTETENKYGKIWVLNPRQPRQALVWRSSPQGLTWSLPGTWLYQISAGNVPPGNPLLEFLGILQEKIVKIWK